MDKVNGTAHILLVDDEPDISSVLKKGLEKAGYKVSVFLDPVEALSKFRAKVYDFLILDLKMPRMDGFTLYEKLLQIDKDARACFLTAYDSDYRQQIRSQFPHLRLDCFLSKPVSISELVNKVKGEMGS